MIKMLNKKQKHYQSGKKLKSVGNINCNYKNGNKKKNQLCRNSKMNS